MSLGLSSDSVSICIDKHFGAVKHHSSTSVLLVQIHCGITSGRVLKGEQKLIHVHLFTELFHEDFSSVIQRNTDDVLNNPHAICLLPPPTSFDSPPIAKLNETPVSVFLRTIEEKSS